MVRHHVAQRAGAFVVSAAFLDSDFFRRGDLHAVDVTAIPDWLENAVAEAKDHDVLHGLFAEVVIDTVDLIFVKNLLEVLIQLFRRLEIRAKGFFNYGTTPVFVFLARESKRAEFLNHLSEIFGSRSEIKKDIAFSLPFFIELYQRIF